MQGSHTPNSTKLFSTEKYSAYGIQSVAVPIIATITPNLANFLAEMWPNLLRKAIKPSAETTLIAFLRISVVFAVYARNCGSVTIPLIAMLLIRYCL